MKGKKKRTRKRKKRILTLNVEQVLEVENNHSVTTAGKTGWGENFQCMLNLERTSREIRLIFKVLMSLQRQLSSDKGENILLMQRGNWTECWPSSYIKSPPVKGRDVLSLHLGYWKEATMTQFYPQIPPNAKSDFNHKKASNTNEWLYSDKRWEVYRFQKCQCHEDQKKKKKRVDRNVSDERKLKRPENYMWCLTPGCTLCWRGNAIKDSTGSTD